MMSMRYLDIDSWSRKVHYNYFRELDYPHFNICGNVDITEFIRFVKANKVSFFLTLLYASAKTANNIEAFRYRIRQDKVVVHDVVSPSFTIMTAEEVFGFCTAGFNDDFKDFYMHASEQMEKTKNNTNVDDEPGRDDLLYITSIPWVSFTSVTHPINMKSVDSIPRISWGKYFEENGRVKLPLSVQVHHALMDGAHVGQYFMDIQEMLDNPEAYFI
jgi:chloramphenicol O-acetyltransferase type A